MFPLYIFPFVFALHFIPGSMSSALPDPKPLPGHMVIPYYIRQKDEQVDVETFIKFLNTFSLKCHNNSKIYLQERKAQDKLRIYCQSFIESGYYNDPKCDQVKFVVKCIILVKSRQFNIFQLWVNLRRPNPRLFSSASFSSQSGQSSTFYFVIIFLLGIIQ